MNAPFPVLDIARLELRFRALETVSLPEFAGSTWRGALGQALRRTVCVCRDTQCRVCLLRESCWYPRLYETPGDARCRLLEGYKDAPHPLVPQPHPLGGECAPGTGLGLDLVLLGRAVEAVPYLVQAAERLARFGLGRGRGKLRLERWELVKTVGEGDEPVAGEQLPWTPPAPCPRCWMELETPLRLRVDNRVVGPERLTFRPLFTTLMRRISLLGCCHGGGTPELDFKALAEQAEGVEILTRELRWFRWSRYSTPQQRLVSMDGLVGRIGLDMGSAPELWPYLWAGQWLHVGKGTSMGMGCYRLRAADGPGE